LRVLCVLCGKANNRNRKERKADAKSRKEIRLFCKLMGPKKTGALTTKNVFVSLSLYFPTVVVV
jgi:hypothetical protein